MYTKARIQTGTESIDTYDIEAENFALAVSMANRIIDAINLRKRGVYHVRLVEVK